MGDHLSYDSRRHEFRQRLPTHHCQRCTSVLYPEDTKCLECEAPRPSSGWAELGRTTDPWLGRTLIDRYLLTRRLGQGASGDVYRAESLSISRQFAAKIISLESHDATINAEHIEARLQREIGALGALRNPHIVSFYDVVTIDDRTVALLMDLIDGRTLEATVTTNGPLEPRRACKLLRQIANGVHEAHEAEMIHRDLKPENIMVEQLPAGDDFVHILDFGIVWREGDVRVTQGFLGTPLYASPEQAVGGQLDRRADIYALGGVFFFMLTGRPPFLDDNVYRVLKAHVSTQPPRLAEIVPGRTFPDELEGLVARMLAKNPKDRPQTLAGVITALDDITDHFGERREGEASDHTLSESIDMQPEPAHGTSHDSELNRTVQSEASVAEADAEAARAKKDNAVKDKKRRASLETSGFFRSDEWDTTGPKAAILRRRTPSQSVEPIGRADNADQLAEGEPGFATSEKRLRGSGLYAVPALVADLDGSHRCASGPGGRLAVVDASRRVHVGLPGQAEPIAIDLQSAPPLTCMALTETKLFTGHSDGTLWQWSLVERVGEIIHQNASASPLTGLDCDGKSRWLIAGTEAGGVYLAEADADGSFQPLRIHSGKAVRAVALTDQQNVFAVARADGTIGIFDVSSPTTLVHRLTAESRVESMAFSNDGYLLAVVFAQKKLALYHVLNGGLLMRNDAMIEQPLSVSFGENDQLVGYCEIDGRIFGWDLHHNLVAHNHS